MLMAVDGPLGAVDWPLRTARLVLRPATSDDAEAVWRYRRLDEVARWITSAPADLDAFVAAVFDAERLTRTIVVERDGEVVGDLSVVVVDGWAQAEVRERAVGVQAELGWVLDPAHQGHGYATEMVGELLRLAFEELGLRRVTAGCFAANKPSWRLMERLGMRREMHTVEESLHRTEGWLDGYGYALLADEWRARSGT
jgi:RimJ/RimL family protein N-acetyltransferase